MDALLDKSQWAGLRERIVEHLSTPLYRNGYALIAGSVLTSGIGFIYWVIAARLFTPEMFGINATLISTMTFLSNTSNLNMGNLLVRFIPGSGKRLPRLVITTYTIAMSVAVVASIAFLLIQPIWASKLSILQNDSVFAIWFVVSTSLWCVFALQDYALTGLRQAIWVPLENLIFAVAKVGLLFALIGAATEGIFWSWSIPVVAVVPAITFLLFGRLIPTQVKAQPETTTPLSLRTGVRFVGNDFIGSLISQAVGSLLPLFVLAKLGAPQAGYLSVAMMIATSLSLVTSNIGSSLLAESAADESKLADYSYRALMHALRLLVPAVVVVVIGAPLLLEVFGKSFTSEATLLLQLMSLSAIPGTVNTLRSNILRVTMRTSAIVAQIIATNGITVAVAFLLVDRMGINAIGVAWLAGQSAVALVILLTEMRPLWLSRLNFQKLVAVRQDIRARMSGGHIRDARQLVETHLPEVLGEVGSQSGMKDVAGWQVLGSLGVDKATLAYRLGSDNRTEAMLKLAESPELIDSLDHQRRVVEGIWANPTLSGWRGIVPRVLAHGALENKAYVVETMLPGINGVEALTQGATGDQILRGASAAIGPLHKATAHTVKVDDALLDEWVSRRVAIVRAALGRMPTRSALPSLEKFSQTLCGTLRGREMTAGWIHGDYVPGNVLVDPASYEMTGIVDWELAEQNALPKMELMWLIMATRLHSQRRELGHVIVAILNDRAEGLTELERDVLAAYPSEGDDALTPREMVAMAWLFHVSSNLGKEMERYSNNWFWLFKNVESVLYYL